MKKVLTLFICFALAVNLVAQETKKKKLRQLSPDRPEQTQSPNTIDAGHFQLETDVVNNTFNYKDAPNSSTLQLLNFNAKVGIQKNMDVEILSNAFSFTTYTKHAKPDSGYTLPNLTFRYKLNLFGNDSGKTALAIMPFINTSNFFYQKPQAKTGGLFIVAGHTINEKYSLNYTGGFTSFALNPFFKQYELFSAFSFVYPLSKTISHFLELSERYNKYADVKNNYSFDTGFTYTPTQNNQFDMGCYYFIPAKAVFIFIGTTFRI